MVGKAEFLPAATILSHILEFRASPSPLQDFSQVIAEGTSFAKSNLSGCRFFKAYLISSDFTSSDLRGASLEDTSLDGAIFTQVDARGAYFSQSLRDVSTMDGADFSDASLPPKLVANLCERKDLDVKNLVTGVTTRDSLMCL